MPEHPASTAPFYSLPAREPVIRASDISRDIAASGVSLETANARVKIYARRKEGRPELLRLRRVGRHTSPNLYECTDSAVAIALSALQDAGVQDHEVLHRAASALYDRDLKSAERDAPLLAGMPAWVRHPVDRALAGIASGQETWSLVVTIYRSPNTPARYVDADLVPQGVSPTPSKALPTDAVPVASLVVVLDQLVSPVLRRLMTEDRH